MAIKKAVKKEETKVVFCGELTGTAQDERLGVAPIISVKFHENGSVITTVGNQNFMPSEKDLVNIRESMNQLAVVLDIEKSKVIVGAWMKRVAKNKTTKGAR